VSTQISISYKVSTKPPNSHCLCLAWVYVSTKSGILRV